MSLVVMHCLAIGGASTTGQWTTLGSGSFVPHDSSLTATYVFSAADSAAGIIDLVLTTTNVGGCVPSTDTVVAPAPAL